MALFETFRYFRRVYQAAHQSLPHREEYERLAEDAFRACSEWFGTPPDAKRPYFLCVSADDTSACAYGFGQYLLYLAPGLDTPEARCENIGHEMYHRVTMRRPGLRRELWIDEMMAFLAGEWFLRRHGYDDYARENRRRYVVRKTRTDIDSLRRFRLRRPFVRVSSRVNWYPDNFYPDVQRLATALNWVVPSNDLRRLPWAKTLSSWIESLPGQSRIRVLRLLEMADESGGSDDTLEWNVKMGRALQALGRFDEAVDEFRAAQRNDSDQDHLFFDIALCLERAGNLGEAREAYAQAMQYDPQDYWAPYNFADTYWAEGNYPAAIEWFQQTLQRKPDWPRALYYLGVAFARNEQREHALDCWRRIVALGDSEYLAWANDALQDYPAHWAQQNRGSQAISDDTHASTHEC